MIKSNLKYTEVGIFYGLFCEENIFKIVLNFSSNTRHFVLLSLHIIGELQYCSYVLIAKGNQIVVKINEKVSSLYNSVCRIEYISYMSLSTL